MDVIEDFPLHALLPKKETQVEQFLIKYPEYNGDDITIAIFDSGVDPGASGLQRLPSGERKLVDLIDCSGAGDVDTSTVVQPAEDRSIQGLTGRKLKIPQAWNNPSNDYHIGVKSAYSLMTTGVAKRVQKELKEKKWDPSHKLKLAEASRAIMEFESKHENVTTEEDKLAHENLKQFAEVLKTLDKNFADVGPVFDCIVFNDGETWRACVDTSESGDLEQCKLLGTFKLTGDFARLSDKDMVNYSVNIYDDGNLLSIVTQASSHGTHVASITGAYFEDQPELNGVAPGAKIISMQIGDMRLDGMETGTAMIRAVKCAIDNKVDVVNMSYGEAAKWPDSGRVVEWMNKMVKEHNIIFLSSAGNDGPALSTVGCPGPTSEDAIGVGAYVSADMMTAEYGMLEKMPGTPYYWSSRGPCVDGALGVSICAPGGAITSIPNWTLSKSQLMNGTSMSSPNATGCVGVLISALKKENIAYSPKSILRALESTALNLVGVSRFTQGYGLVQVEKAYDFIKELVKLDKFHDQLHFKVSCKNKKGIYIRNPVDHGAPEKYTLTVSPIFRKNAENELKIAFNINACLISTESWVKTASHLDVCNSSRNFAVNINTNGLQPGYHYAEIQGFNVKCPATGPLFKFPITVIIPEVISGKCVDIEMKLKIFKPAAIQRRFYEIPSSATWATVTFSSTDSFQDTVYIIQTLYLEDDCGFTHHEQHKAITMKANSPATKDVTFKVDGGKTVEIAIARNWNSSGDTQLHTTLSFYGLQPNKNEVTLLRSKLFTEVTVSSELGFEQINPSVNMTHHVTSVNPKEHKIGPLGERDVLPDNEQIYGLELTYLYTLASKSQDIMVVAPLLNDLLYESKYESQLCLIYDSNKALVGKSDAFPQKFKYTSKLIKGDYTIKLQVRHSNIESLEALKDMVVEIHMVLPTPISLDLYEKRKALFEKTNKFKLQLLSPRQQCKIYITVPTDEKVYPKHFKAGDRLVGSITYTGKPAKAKACYPVTLVNNIGNQKKQDKKENGKTVDEEYKEAYDEFLITWLAKLDSEEGKNELFEKSSKSLSCLDGQLNMLDASEKRKEKLGEIISLSKNILSEIDEKELLSYVGTKVDSNDNSSTIKTRIEKLKSLYINSNIKLGTVSSELIQDTENILTQEQREELVVDVNSCYHNLLKVIDANESRMLLFTVQHGIVHNQYGRSLKALLKYFDDNGYNKKNYQLFLNLVGLCEWNHIVGFYCNTELMKFPNSYQLF